MESPGRKTVLPNGRPIFSVYLRLCALTIFFLGCGFGPFFPQPRSHVSHVMKYLRESPDVELEIGSMKKVRLAPGENDVRNWLEIVSSFSLYVEGEKGRLLFRCKVAQTRRNPLEIFDVEMERI